MQAKVLDRDGHEKMECPKGWPYITNMASTNVRDVFFILFSVVSRFDQLVISFQLFSLQGHIAMVNCGCWHPRVRENFLTCSNDG